MKKSPPHSSADVCVYVYKNMYMCMCLVFLAYVAEEMPPHSSSDACLYLSLCLYLCPLTRLQMHVSICLYASIYVCLCLCLSLSLLLPPCRGEPVFEKGENPLFPLRGEHVLRWELNVTPNPIFSFFLSGELREVNVIPKPTCKLVAGW
jgi:hypothetical protein